MPHAILVLSLAILAQAQDRSVEARALVAAQQISAKTLDQSLDDKPFAEWFKTQVGSAVTVAWSVTDCGEGDGNPASPSRDLPMCGEAVANLTRTKKAVVQIVVGTMKKGVVSTPALWSAAILDGNNVTFYKTLPELVKALGGGALQ